jgi:hypothetical protein
MYMAGNGRANSLLFPVYCSISVNAVGCEYVRLVLIVQCDQFKDLDIVFYFLKQAPKNCPQKPVQ